ncbi:hypothetical protein ONS95_007755 [Cadophora gregata]|uniref:uncharacterized protein n=1 Tax=Cadophora gregata TaxID=51156 RepID=UPI0026DCDDD3|nr:uncharacterized protein ONS95_007755 [Cadophora gregata]KAK0118883.1 hypothetical protein ONS96_011961 [Cadophora gregata f. sp. sojae]KAK0126136.1 hypothetical protein ONS95_007755 [Cadophora gregata]
MSTNTPGPSPVRELNSFNNSRTYSRQPLTVMRENALLAQLEVSSNKGRPVTYALATMRDHGPALLKNRVRNANRHRDHLLVMPNQNRRRSGRPRDTNTSTMKQIEASRTKWMKVARGSFIVWSALVELHGFLPSHTAAHNMVTAMERAIHTDYLAEMNILDPNQTVARINRFDMYRR